MAYASWSVVFGEQPSAAKWNILGTNDAVFNNGTGLPSAGAQAGSVATSQTTASTSYTDLATVGPSVTVTIGATGLALVIFSCLLANNTGSSISTMSFVASGANTIAIGTYELANTEAANYSTTFSKAILLTGLAAGSTTFKAQYKVNGGTGTFLNREISVIPL